MHDRERIVVLPGDGIGPEVIAQGMKLLQALAEPAGLQLEFEEHAIGGAALARHGVPVLPETLQRCREAHAVLLGAVGDPAYDSNPPHLRPERALLDLRAHLGVYCNLRPVRLHKALSHASTIKPEVVQDIDMLVVRELTGGLYFGEPAGVTHKNGTRSAVNTMSYTEAEIRRIAHKAFQLARLRRCRLTSVDKANVLAVSQLWRAVVDEVAREYADVEMEHMLVDNCAMQLIRNPRRFDVILTGNLFGDILSDEASMLTGSIGMLPSASLGDGAPLFEPVHGAAPDIAGQGIANPIAMLKSVGMLFKYTLQRPVVTSIIEDAISVVLSRGYHTPDMALPNGTRVNTAGLCDHIIEETLQAFSAPLLTA